MKFLCSRLVRVLVLAALSGPLLGADQSLWKAGTAKAEITPTQPLWMAGYGSRTKPAEGKEMSLWIKAGFEPCLSEHPGFHGDLLRGGDPGHSLLALVIQYVLRIVFLGWLYRLGGAVFGILKGVLTVSVLFLVLTAFLPKGTPLIRDSMSGPYVSMVSEQLAALVSKEIKAEFSAKLDALKKARNSLK